MNEVLVAVKPVFDVIDDGQFDPRDSMNSRVGVEHCCVCGSPLMYVRVEDFGESMDYTWFCAVCGQEQMGLEVPKINV